MQVVEVSNKMEEDPRALAPVNDTGQDWENADKIRFVT